MGFLARDDSPVIWRGPMLHSVIRQFFHDVSWDELDYLVVDMPPGTGDVALSLSQTVPVAGAIVVTTPQEVSLADRRNAVRMYQKLNIPVLGLIENMSYFVCPSCGHESDIFGRGGGEDVAGELDSRSSGRFRSTNPSGWAATPASPSSRASRTRRPHARSWQPRNRPRRRSLSRPTAGRSRSRW